MYLGNLNIRSEWAEFVRKEEEVNKIICKYLRELYALNIEDYAHKTYIDVTGGIKKDLPTEEERYNALKYIDEFVNEEMADFDSKMKPNSKFFRRQLFEAITKQTIPQEQKDKMIKLFEQRFLQVKNQKWTTGRKSAWGRRASTDTDSVIKIFNNIDKSNEKENTEIIIPDDIDPEDMQRRIKDFYYQFFNKKNRKDRKGNFVVTPEDQAKFSAIGLANELEDAMLENSDIRRYLATYIATELYNIIEDERAKAIATERSPGKNKEYDFHTETILSYKNKKGLEDAAKFDMFFDSKTNLMSLGVRLDDYIITSAKVIDILENSTHMESSLLTYNNQHSKDNELLLEYLLSIYKDLKYYYLIEKEKKEVYSLSYLVDKDKICLDPNGLYLDQTALLDNKYQLWYAKAVRK